MTIKPDLLNEVISDLLKSVILRDWKYRFHESNPNCSQIVFCMPANLLAERQVT